MFIYWDKFNRLTVIKNIWYKYKTHIAYLCKCDCWNETVATYQQLKEWNKKSCWCSRIWMNSSHKKSRTRIYKIWASMKRRCDKQIKHYWERWITYCDKWKLFEWFFDDMKEWYFENLSIDRIDVNWSYCKENCRWADSKMQANNKRNNKIISIDWESRTLSQWLSHLWIDNSTYYSRTHWQWLSDIDALTIPIEKRNVPIYYNWISLSLKWWADSLWLQYKTLYRRIYIKKYPLDKALNQNLIRWKK